MIWHSYWENKKGVVFLPHHVYTWSTAHRCRLTASCGPSVTETGHNSWSGTFHTKLGFTQTSNSFSGLSTAENIKFQGFPRFKNAFPKIFQVHYLHIIRNSGRNSNNDSTCWLTTHTTVHGKIPAWRQHNIFHKFCRVIQDQSHSSAPSRARNFKLNYFSSYSTTRPMTRCPQCWNRRHICATPHRFLMLGPWTNKTGKIYLKSKVNMIVSSQPINFLCTCWCFHAPVCQ